MLKRVLKLLATVLALVILAFTAFVGYLTFTDYKPPEKISLQAENNQPAIMEKDKPFSILTFNIGYCGLDKAQDFFMDGGTKSRSSSKEQTIKNEKGIMDFIGSEKPDIIMLQEVDVNASRSYHINEAEDFIKYFSSYSYNLGLNYKVPWVPVPVSDPMGSVKSGLVSMFRFKVNQSTRYQYPGQEKWPVQLFELDRCFVESRLQVKDGKELVLINSHLSAFDKGGEIRKQQLGFLKQHMQEEYSKGNYIIVGGDWNHVLPGTDPARFKSAEEWPFWLQNLPSDFTPMGWNWAVDGETPSVRTVATSYTRGINYLAVIDGFVVSPNVEIQVASGHSLDFENSDHNPVTGVFYLR